MVIFYLKFLFVYYNYLKIFIDFINFEKNIFNKNEKIIYFFLINKNYFCNQLFYKK